MCPVNVFWNGSGCWVFFAWLALMGSMNVSVHGQENQRVFIHNGKPVGIHDEEGKWKQRDAVLEAQGERVYLYADRMIAVGDFTVSARLRMQNQLKSTAGFVLGDSFFGFEGAKGEDCAYPGVEILPDDTIVTTTYGHWVAGKQPYIVSVRLKLAELDLKWNRQQKEPALQENE